MLDRTSASSEPDTPADDDEGLFIKLKAWVKEDWDKSGDWREAAREDYAFVAGEQWTEEDKTKLRDQLRPVITMNRIDPIIDSVSGSEVANRQEVRYIPRTEGDAKVNELYTSSAQWFRDQCDAEDEESDAFRDTLICGMGWTDTRLDYETDPDGEPKIERNDPLEMGWDCAARKRNLSDSRRMWRARKMPLAEAEEMFPDFEPEQLNAKWFNEGGEKDSEHHTDRSPYDDTGTDASATLKMVTIVQIQWYEKETFYRVPDPQNPQNLVDLSVEEHKDLKAKAKAMGFPLRSVKSARRVYRQAFLGSEVLEKGDAPCKEHFSYNCITGKRDRNENNWYGLVRGMKDPQRWANKWLSQSLHILNSSAKGGIMAERGSFDNETDAERSWAKHDEITWLKPNAIKDGKIEAKPQAPLPVGFYQLMEFAISSIRDTSGVNIETLGMREQQQAASLDRQRKQSSMTILQPMFDSLRRYRKMQGRQLLYIIRTYLSDGRLVKIVGEEGAQYVPLIKQPGTEKYDVIVDDAPTSPNQKEQTWGIMQGLLPAIGKMIPADVWPIIIEYSPLPTSAVDKFKKAMEPPKGPDGQPLPPKPDPELVKAQQMAQIEQDKVKAKLAMDQQAQDAQLQADMRKAEHEVDIERMKAANAIQLAREKQAADIEMAREKAAADMQIQSMLGEARAQAELTRAANSPAPERTQ